MRTITLEISDDGMCCVREGDKYQDHLDSGEANWVLVHLLLGHNALSTQEQHDALRKQFDCIDPTEGANPQ